MAILFADDLFMIAQSTEKLQLLLNGGCMFYTAASAALCAPKSKWSTNTRVAAWELHIGPFHDEMQAAACAAQCRGWRRRIDDARIPSVEKVQHRATWVKIKGDITFLVRSGIPCQWGEATKPALRQASSLRQHLKDWTAGIGLEEAQMKVCHEPLYIVDPKSGEKGYLEYVPPDCPIKYLGYLICADLNWRPALEAVHAKLDKLLRQVRRGKQLGLPRDLFLQACNSKIGGMLGYYLVGIPTSDREMTNINNKVAQAFSPVKSLSPHQIRMLPPIGLGVMDVELDIAQRRIKMATDTLHSNDVEGSALRWCLRVLQLVHQVPHFWWSDPRVARTGTNRGFVEGVTQSLKVMELAILCTTEWFDRPPADSTLWERGFKPDTPEQDMLHIAKRARTHRVHTLKELESKRHLFTDFEEHRVHQALEHVLPTDPGPLFTLIRRRLEEPVNLPPDTSMSDGSGQPHTTAAQVDGIDPGYGTVGRVLCADSMAVVGELLGLTVSMQRLTDNGSYDGTAISDCQGAIGEVHKTRAVDFHPFRHTQQHCSLLRYYLWTRIDPKNTITLAWFPGHSEDSEVDPAMQGIQAAQLTTDRLAAEGQEPAMDPIRTTAVFDFDFPFVLATEDGKRAHGTLAQRVGRRRREPSFHINRRQKRRERVHGVSWVNIPTSLFYLPTTNTPYDSTKPWPSRLRNKYDESAAREELLQSPMLARAAINGGASHLTATRLDMLGGLTELATAAAPTAPAQRQRATCPFCVKQPDDSLQHLVWECQFDRHGTATARTFNAEEVAKRIRQRFRSGMMMAMLDTGCPLTQTVMQPTVDGKDGKVKAAHSGQSEERQTRDRKEATVVKYETIRAIAKAKIRAKLQHQPALLWFQGKERAVEADRARLRQAKAVGLKRTAATKALTVIAARLTSTLADEREGWARRKGNDDIMPKYVDAPAKVSPALDCPTKEVGTEAVDVALPEPVLFAQALTCAFHNLGPMEVVGKVLEEGDPWAGNTWVDLVAGRQPYKTEEPSLPTLRYGGLVDCRISWEEARQMRRAAQRVGQPLLYIAVAGITSPTARVGYALGKGEWLLRNDGRCVAQHGYLMYVAGEHLTDPTGKGYLPATIRHWKRLRMDTDEGAQPDMETPDSLRRQLAENIVEYHKGKDSETWWQHALSGAEGQCRGAGLLSNETHRELQPHMTKRGFAQLYASYHWQMGVLVSSLVSCRAAVADLVTKAEQGATDGELTERLRQFIRAPPPIRSQRQGTYAWSGVDRAKGRLPACSECFGKGKVTTKRRDCPDGTTTCPSCEGATTWAARDGNANDSEEDPRSPGTRKGCRHLPPRRELVEVLRRLWREWIPKDSAPRHPHGIIGPGTCDGCSKALVSDKGTESGLLLVDGQVLCDSCSARWTEQARNRLMLDRGEECVYLHTTKPKRTYCLKCWSRNSEAVADLSRELRRIATSHLLRQLLRSHPVNLRWALIKEVEALWAAVPRAEEFGVPASILWNISSWLQRHASHWLMASPHLADTSLRVDFRKPNWLALANAVPPAEPTYKAATRHGNLHSETVRRTAGLSAAKGLANLQVTLKRHNNVALPKTRAQLCMLPVLIGLDDKRDSLPLAEPADSHITQSEQATCKKCEYNKGDAFDGKEGKQVYHCLACNTWLHEACMSRREWETIILHDHLEQGRQQEMFSPEDLGQERSDKIRRYHEEMETEEGATSLPPWRCAGCTDKRQFAMTRILELSRTPTGKLMAVVEYMGYPRGELLDMEELIDPANALTDAFQAVQTLAADAHRTVHYIITEIKRGETTVPSLMHQGNHTSVISIDALQRRGYCRDSCTIFRLTPNVPFFLPLAVADLMTDCEGKSLGLIPAEATSTTTTRRRASLKRIIGHLTTVTDGAFSFPAALADGTWGDGAWRGLELIAGARYSDLKQALEDFNTVYGPQQWRELLQRDVPGLTATDVEWLSTIKEEVRPKKKTKTPGARVECRKRKGDRGTHRDAPGKQRRGESGILTPTRETPGRAASVSPGETSGAMDLDDNPLTSDRGRRTVGHEGGGGG